MTTGPGASRPDAGADPSFGLADLLVDELARAGLAHVSVAPGSRSTPLVLALARHPGIAVHVHLDERSAAFFALGAAKASGRAAGVVCTSGSASAHLHPAAVEARMSRTPLLLLTADRPPELRDTGAPQTIDQVKMFGSTVRWFTELGPPEPGAEAARYWRSTACRAWAEAHGPPAGPVHMNLPFREPLVPPAGARTPADHEGRPDHQPWTASAALPRSPSKAEVSDLAALVARHPRGLLVVGWGDGLDPAAVASFASAAGWPLLADTISGARAGEHAVSTYEALLRVPSFATTCLPDLVVRVGAPLTSKVAGTWLDHTVPQVLVDPDGAWLDPARAACRRVAADPSLLLREVAGALPAPGPEGSGWLSAWQRAEHRARQAMDDLLDSWEDAFEGRVARDLVDWLPDDTVLVAGSSMPVRDLEAFARPRHGLRMLSNRGANGIDGFVSTVLGAAAGAGRRVAGLCGDLTFLHDAGGLLWADRRGLDAVMVVVDNGGGGIFSFLPQADLSAHFEELFLTPHRLDLGALAAAHHLPCQRVSRAHELIPALERAWDGGGVQVVVVAADPAGNVARHRQIWDAVAAAL